MPRAFLRYAGRCACGTLRQLDGSRERCSTCRRSRRAERNAQVPPRVKTDAAGTACQAVRVREARRFDEAMRSAQPRASVTSRGAACDSAHARMRAKRAERREARHDVATRSL